LKCLVIDFGGTLTKSCLMDENAEIINKSEEPSPLASDDDFIGFLKGIYDKNRESIDGVTISMPGMIDIKSGLLKGGGAFESLWGKNLYDIIRSVITVPFSVENDGKCGALAEVWKGNLKDVEDGVVVIIGTGDAGGIIKNRKIHRGFHNTAGEISYLMSRPGEYGTQNMMCMHAAMMGLTMKSAAAKGYDRSALESGALRQNTLGEIYSTKTASDGKNPPKNEIVDGRLVFKWLEEGDTEIVAVYKDFIEHIGMMLFNIQVVFDPEKIAIGGGISKEPRLIPDIRAELDRIRQPIAEAGAPDITLVSCKYLGDANMVGAMFNFLQNHNPEMI
jgi:predicted NBD/HSP70 family sugar kinase